MYLSRKYRNGKAFQMGGQNFTFSDGDSLITDSEQYVPCLKNIAIKLIVACLVQMYRNAGLSDRKELSIHAFIGCYF